MTLKEVFAEKGYNIHVSKAGIVYKNDVPVDNKPLDSTKPMCLTSTTRKQENEKMREELNKAKADQHPNFVFDGYFKYVASK